MTPWGTEQKTLAPANTTQRKMRNSRNVFLPIRNFFCLSLFLCVSCGLVTVLVSPKICSAIRYIYTRDETTEQDTILVRARPD